MNVLLVGEESAGIQTVKAIMKTDHRLVAVMASPDKTNSHTATLWQVAKHLGLPTWPAKSVKEAAFARQVRDAEVDILLNVHSLYIINGEVVEAPTIGSFNLHPGPLPRYAGLNAPSWAIFRGETMHGVTVHKMEREIDTGHIVYQTLFDIEESDTALTVSIKCIKEGVAMMTRLLETADNDPSSIPLIPQDLSKREYFKPGAPKIGGLFRSLTARQLVNFVRACDYSPLPSPWGVPQVRLGNQILSLIKATVTGNPTDAIPGTVGQVNGTSVNVACIDEWIDISRLLVEGGYFNASEILKPGDQMEDIISDQSAHVA